MTPLTLPIEIEPILVAYLTRFDEITSSVGTELPADYRATEHQAVTFTDIGDGATIPDLRLDHARFQFTSWAPDREAAWTLIATVCAALGQLRNHVTPNGVIGRARKIQRPSWTPDTSVTPHTPRFVTVWDVVAHPL